MNQKKQDKKLSLQEPAALPPKKKNTRFTTSFQADVEKQWGSFFGGILQFDLGTKLEVFRCIKNLKFLNFKAKMVSCYWNDGSFPDRFIIIFSCTDLPAKAPLANMQKLSVERNQRLRNFHNKISNPFGTSGFFQK